MAEETWSERELVILEAIFEREETGEMFTSVDEIAEATELDLEVARRGAHDLADAGFITGAGPQMLGSGWDLARIRLQERGRRAIGQWPSEDAYDSLVRMLQSRIAEESDPERRGRLQKLLGAVTDVGKDVDGNVLAAWFRQMTGLG